MGLDWKKALGVILPGIAGPALAAGSTPGGQNFMDDPMGFLSGTQAARRRMANATLGANERLEMGLERAGGIMDPYQQAGRQGLDPLRDIALGDFDYEQLLEDPEFQFLMEQGISGIDRSAASRGKLRSGQTMKALSRYGQGLATQNISNRFARLADLVGVGERSGTFLADAALRAAGAQAGNVMGAGQVGASAAMSRAQFGQDLFRDALAGFTAGTPGGVPGSGAGAAPTWHSNASQGYIK